MLYMRFYERAPCSLLSYVIPFVTLWVFQISAFGTRTMDPIYRLFIDIGPSLLLYISWEFYASCLDFNIVHMPFGISFPPIQFCFQCCVEALSVQNQIETYSINKHILLCHHLPHFSPPSLCVYEFEKKFYFDFLILN